jgi:tRNA(Arg) A34 adenosine deaminase TadA
MCAGAMYWSGIGRVVYALSSETLQAIVNDDEGDSTLGSRAASCSPGAGAESRSRGPILEGQPREVHQGFW